MVVALAGKRGWGGDEVARDQCNRVEPTVQAQLQKEETERERERQTDRQSERE